MGNDLPKKLENSPLIAATVELRFKNAIPNGVLLGKFFPSLGSDYEDLQVIGPGNVPEAALKQNPNLIFLPQYRAKGSNSAAYQVLFGPRVVIFAMRGPSFDIDFASDGPLQKLLGNLERHDVLIELERAGLRYINLFEGRKSLEHMAVNTSISGDDISAHISSMRFEIPQDSFKLTVTIAKNATANVSDDNIGMVAAPSPENTKKGAILDIDASTTFDSAVHRPYANEILAKLIDAHQHAEQIFFKALTPSFVESLGPSYR